MPVRNWLFGFSRIINSNRNKRRRQRGVLVCYALAQWDFRRKWSNSRGLSLALIVHVSSSPHDQSQFHATQIKRTILDSLLSFILIFSPIVSVCLSWSVKAKINSTRRSIRRFAFLFIIFFLIFAFISIYINVYGKPLLSFPLCWPFYANNRFACFQETTIQVLKMRQFLKSKIPSGPLPTLHWITILLKIVYSGKESLILLCEVRIAKRAKFSSYAGDNQLRRVTGGLLFLDLIFIFGRLN